MGSFTKKITAIFLRHPLLYYLRYSIISRNAKGPAVENIGCFNDFNKLEDLPKLFFEVNAKINIDASLSEFEKALIIATFLRTSIPGGRGLGLSSENTLTYMLANKGGVCSDFSQVFNIFCMINGIKVKEWGCIDRFYKTEFGHSFNEIFDSKLQKWIAIDIHKGILFQNRKEKTFYSVLELFGSLRAGETLKCHFFSDYVPPKLERISFVYCKKTIPFVISNYCNKSNDLYIKRFQKLLPPFAINALLILTGKNSNFIFVLDNYKSKLVTEYIEGIRFFKPVLK